MTNLEKAIELARKHEALYGIRNRKECCVAACQEMAEWKEQQLIEKALEFITEWFYEHTHTNMVCSEEFESVDALIKRFKKVMRGMKVCIISDSIYGDYKKGEIAEYVDTVRGGDDRPCGVLIKQDGSFVMADFNHFKAFVGIKEGGEE